MRIAPSIASRPKACKSPAAGCVKYVEAERNSRPGDERIDSEPASYFVEYRSDASPRHSVEAKGTVASQDWNTLQEGDPIEVAYPEQDLRNILVRTNMASGNEVFYMIGMGVLLLLFGAGPVRMGRGATPVQVGAPGS